MPELRYRQASSQGNPHAAPAAPLASTSPSADGSEEENEDEEETVDIPVAYVGQKFVSSLFALTIN